MVLKTKSNVEDNFESDLRNACEMIKRDYRCLNIREIIQVLRILFFFNVSSKTVVVQTLLQSLRVQLEQLSFYDIANLMNLLSGCEATPLGDALLSALLIVFKIQLSENLDMDDISKLHNAIDIVCKNNQNAVADIIKELMMTSVDIPLKHALIIFWCFHYISNISNSKMKILSHVQGMLTKQARHLSLGEINVTLECMKPASFNAQTKLYNDALVDAIINVLCQKQISLHEGLSVLNKLNTLTHSSIPLLDYLAAKCFKDNFNMPHLWHITNFVHGLVIADYKPIFWDEIRSAIINSPLLKTADALTLTILTYNLMSLDCFDSGLLAKVFSMDANVITETRTRRSLAPWVEKALGGPEYIKNRLKTNLCNIIDHVVVIQQDGHLVKINTGNEGDENKPTPITDVHIPPGSQMLLIVNCPKKAYANNTQRLKSTWSLRLKLIEAETKLPLIAINYFLYRQLPDNEKVPYLVQAIKLKCGNIVIKTM
ncbi:hypothetical protein KM043_001883 [Ampulex compressa]|nr:hypothetical protein KM043_001883 [Ampulex compressa]